MKCDELKLYSQCYDGNDGLFYHHTEVDEAIAELKQKLESVQASMYADVMDANMEVRRLKRALYIVLARSFCCMRELAARNALYDDECKWDNFKTTCLKKAEEYKMSECTNYNDYGKMLVRASRQVGKSTFRFAQLLNWLSFRDHPQDFKPLEFKMELVSIKEADK